MTLRSVLRAVTVAVVALGAATPAVRADEDVAVKGRAVAKAILLRWITSDPQGREAIKGHEAEADRDLDAFVARFSPARAALVLEEHPTDAQRKAVDDSLARDSKIVEGIGVTLPRPTLIGLDLWRGGKASFAELVVLDSILLDMIERLNRSLKESPPPPPPAPPAATGAFATPEAWYAGLLDAVRAGDYAAFERLYEPKAARELSRDDLALAVSRLHELGTGGKFSETKDGVRVCAPDGRFLTTLRRSSDGWKAAAPFPE